MLLHLMCDIRLIKAHKNGTSLALQKSVLGHIMPGVDDDNDTTGTLVDIIRGIRMNFKR
jgi:hypothetical protein